MLGGLVDQLMTLMPELAVYTGMPAARGGQWLQRRFNDHSPAGEQALRDALAQARRSLDDIACPSDNARAQSHLAVTRTIFDNALSTARHHPFGHVQPFWFSGHIPYVVNQISGPHIDAFTHMTVQQSVTNLIEGEAFIAKLSDSGRAIDGLIEKMQYDAALGCIPPAALMHGSSARLDAFMHPRPKRHPLVGTLETKLAAAGVDEKTRRHMRKQAARAIDKTLYPAFDRLRQNCNRLAALNSAADGVWALPDGDAYYARQVAILGDTVSTPDEVHMLGLDEVARITADMDQRLRALGYDSGSVGTRMAALALEPRFQFAATPEGQRELFDYVEQLIVRIQELQPQFLNPGSMPRHPIVVRAVPRTTEASAPGGFYDGPTHDGSRPGIFWINLRDMAAVSRFRLPTLTYHEAVPGHHLQGTATMNQSDLPFLVKLASFNAWQEGWALYAEQLAAELGLYNDDPYGDLGRLQDALFRAARLVCDTGLHHKRWSRAQTIAWLQATTGIPESRVIAEIERYMAWPGQALGYKLGQIRLTEMREDARRRMGGRFDLRAFHDIVLQGGPMPLAMLAERVARWADPA